MQRLEVSGSVRPL